ncbi:hypothetical protein Salat_2784200 [Sesamum alatum]|uniref:Nuclease associated modular domain-containing protein n=1 Tax=Sesamum alatum TaxID=300844 RepID=A0AAE1XLN3_9LAMI|nr:hypothetical protein Salat_2784200 [Sesamum alatum]
MCKVVVEYVWVPQRCETCKGVGHEGSNHPTIRTLVHRTTPPIQCALDFRLNELPMPLLDIAISQPCSCFGNNILAFRSESCFYNKLVVGNGRGLGLASAFSWKKFCITEKVGKNHSLGRVEVWRGGLIIKAVATLEIGNATHKNEVVKGYQNRLRMDIDSVKSNSPAFEPQSSSEDSTELDERERLRRMRISKANKGNTPWNKGRKHTPETLQRIKERTRLAMQDPKVKMKLVNMGHAQSEETRTKIGVGVRLGWARRREKLMLQEKCYFEWQNLIAEAAQKGLSGEEELQWDSYKTLDKQLEKEWLQSVEERKSMPRPKGSKRAPKSAEQKRKISEAISAKWADPEYRNRVCSSLAKFHGISERVERKPRRKPSGDGQTRKRSPIKKDETDNIAKRETKSPVHRVRSKRRKAPSYKDPLASSKLEMLKNIRAQRAAAMSKRSEAIFRAKLLIAEAEKASKALELAAQTNPHVQKSLIESRELIAEALQFIESIENDDPISFENDNGLSENSTERVPHDEEDLDTSIQTPDVINHSTVNGVHSLSSSKTEDFSFNKFGLPDLVNGNSSSPCHNVLHESKQKFDQMRSNSFLSLELSHTVNCSKFTTNLADPELNPNGGTEHTEKPLVDGLEFHPENVEAPKKEKPLVDGSEFQPENVEAPKKAANIIKKWVRGRLVEVVEET